MTRILGIETSCDETSAAVLEGTGDDVRVQSLVILSQDVHRVFGGVVPEIASRAHLTAIVPVVEQALADSGSTDIDAVAVTNAPGLVGALLVGVAFGKAFAFSRDVPVVGVHHMEGHLFATALEHGAAVPPFTALLVSGGHTLLIDVEAWGRYRLLGRTRDDAAGEAFDKVAKLMGLGYPGGKIIDELSRSGDRKRIRIPRAHVRGAPMDFSFSGVKTSVATLLRSEAGAALASKDLAASFQEAVVDMLVKPTIAAARELGVDTIVLTGGVAANSRLRDKLAETAAEDGRRLIAPSFKFCTDNAAMIALAGSYRLLRGERDDLAIDAEANLAL